LYKDLKKKIRKKREEFCREQREFLDGISSLGFAIFVARYLLIIHDALSRGNEGLIWSWEEFNNSGAMMSNCLYLLYAKSWAATVKR